MAKLYQLASPGPDESVLDFLDRMKTEAEGGEVVSAATVLVFPSGYVGTGFQLGKDADYWRLLGAVSYLESRINKEIEEA